MFPNLSHEIKLCSSPPTPVFAGRKYFQSDDFENDAEEIRMQIIKDELNEVKQKYGDERRSRIEFSATDFKIEDTIPDTEVVITISHLGYIKRTSSSEYKVQNRGG